MAKIPYSEFVEGLDAAAALDGTESVVVLQGGVPVESTTQDIADLGGGGAGYLVYTALLSQTGTDAPVATVLENTLAGTVVWTYDDVGSYIGTLAGVFIINKTVIILGASNGAGQGNAAFRSSDNTVGIVSANGSGTPANDLLYETPIEIRVYP